MLLVSCSSDITLQLSPAVQHGPVCIMTVTVELHLVGFKALSSHFHGCQLLVLESIHPEVVPGTGNMLCLSNTFPKHSKGPSAAGK